jgi:hypothetical protein
MGQKKGSINYSAVSKRQIPAKATVGFIWLSLFFSPIHAEAETYEPVHNTTTDNSNVSLKNLPTYGPLTPGKVALVKITGEGGPGGIGPIVVKNDSGFDITDLHWKIPSSEEIRGKKVVGENDVPQNWNQPDVQFGDKNNNKQAGESNIFNRITPQGAGPTKELVFDDGVIKNGANFTDGKIPQGQGKITTHYAFVSYM